MTLNGIDVSNAQGATFNWAPYRGKIAFAFIKITEGLTYGDPYAVRNMTQARNEGITRGAYHFLRANLPASAQASWFLARARAAGLSAGDLVMVDVETSDGKVAAGVAACASAFAAEVRAATGAWPVVYTDQSFAYGGYCAGLGNCPAFIANPSGVQLHMPIGEWNLVSFEQTGQRGVDTDVFHGTAAQLAKLAIPGAVKTAPPSSGEPAWPAGMILEYGSVGAAVEALQKAFRDSGIRGVRGIAVDGEFGDQTQTATRNFEAAEGLAVDAGIAGPQVRNALIRLGRLTAAGEAIA